jgi:hypothetical protein
MQACPVLIGHWWTWHPPVGCFIAVVAVLAFVYPIFYEDGKISNAKKGTWTLAVLILVLLEINSTRLDRNEHNIDQQAALCEQTNRFSGIASTLEQDITSNESHFSATMRTEAGILATTKEVGELSRRDLENVTGGTAFAYADPFDTSADATSLVLRNAGDQVLSGIDVVVEKVVNGCELKANSLCRQEFDFGMMTPLQMGTLGPHEHKPIQRGIAFNANGSGESLYSIRMSAQNGQAIEQMWLRKSALHHGFAYRYSVVRVIHGKRHPGDFNVGAETYRTLKTVGWTEYSPSESLDGIHPYDRTRQPTPAPGK